MYFLSIQLLKELLQSSHVTHILSPFLLIAFSLYNLFDFFFFFFLQFFILKRSNNFFTVEIINNICPWHSIFNLFNHKSFFRQILSGIFCKIVFLFQYSYMIMNVKFRIFLIIFFVKVNICAWLYISSMYLLTMSAKSSIYTFWYWSHISIIFLRVPINISATTDFLCVLNTFLYYYPVTLISLIYCEIFLQYSSNSISTIFCLVCD